MPLASRRPTRALTTRLLSAMTRRQITSQALICRRCRTALATRTSNSLRPPKRAFTTSLRVRAESLLPTTHYEFFPESLAAGPPPGGPFNIDLASLRREFLQLQAKAHPDRHQGSDRAKAEALSSRINEAYKVLQDPLLRAQYLLQLRGIDLANDETAKEEDQELLMEVLEAREEIENAEEEEQLDGLADQFERRIGESVRGLEEAFKMEDVEAAKRESVRLRYWVNIKDSIRGWEKGKPVVLVH